MSGERDVARSTISGPAREENGLDGSLLTPPPDLIQDELVRLRGRLLGGRGPGASDREIAAHTKGRRTVGALPTVVERELVQIRAELARGDADALMTDLDRFRARLASTLDELVWRAAPRHLQAQAIRAARARCAALLGAPAPERSSSEVTGTRGDELWPVAVRAAAFGAAATVTLGLLVHSVRRQPR